VDFNLDGAMSRVVQGLGLHVTDTFHYTPQPLAFAAPTGGNLVSEAFVPGIQVQRIDSFTNAAKVDASYFFFPFMGVTSTYADRRIRFGDPIATPSGVSQGGFIDTNFQTLTSGLVGRPSLSDTIFLAHQYQKAAPADSERGDNGFSAQGAIARWSRSITPAFQATVEGGFSVVSSSSDVYPVGTVSLQWKEQYTTVVVSYSQTVAASFYVTSTALLNQLVTGTVRRQITDHLSLSVNGSYAVNESIPDSSLLRFESYTITPSLNYFIGRTFTATLSYTHSQFKQTFVSQTSPFDRNLVQLSLTAEWK
jgi:hypothetical protein